MGRRKIEIKAIKDDRNRSVTFLKRKGGLFKKAHELSVLCSVEVAVIIFGTNKKLYEYSSHDIHDTISRYSYYQGPHEHKGPQDYANKQGGDDDDDEDVEEGQPDDQGQPHQAQGGPPQIHNQAVYPPHMRQGPSASPPIGNGNVQFQRQTPQPPMGMGSRPASRNDIIRRNTPHIPPHSTPPMHTPPMPGPGHPQNGFSHQMPSQVFAVSGQQPMYQQQQHQPPQHPHTASFPPSGFTQFQPPNSQLQQIYQHQQQQQHQRQQQQHQQQHQQQQQDLRRPPMPPNFQEPPRPRSHPQVQIQAPPSQNMSPPQPPPEEQNNEEGLQPHQPRPVKSHSIFTPIEGQKSMLIPPWGASPIDKQEAPVKSEHDDRSKSADPSSLQRLKADPPTVPPPLPKPSESFYQQAHPAQPTPSLSGDASKRPRLKVHIPSEPSEDGASAGSGPGSTAKGQDASSHSTPSKNKDQPAGSGVVLPPPSPSASAILSAGATGPPNPFARPLPPTSGPGQGSTFSSGQGAFDNQTPISALPSRFAGQLLPSPSSFFTEWNFSSRNGDESSILPSPLGFQTPVNLHGPSFGPTSAAPKDESSDSQKRKLEEEQQQRDQGDKRVKT